jgi:hypothetical protein
MIRLALDWLSSEIFESASERAGNARSGLLQAAADLELMIPDEPSPVESTAIWRSLHAEMQMAGDSAAEGYSVARLHIKPADGSTVGFDTTLRPGPVTELIASACVIAQLELLKHAAYIGLDN